MDTAHSLTQAVFMLVKHPHLLSDPPFVETRWTMVRDWETPRNLAEHVGTPSDHRITKWKFPGGTREDIKFLTTQLRITDPKNYQKMKRYIKWVIKRRPVEYSSLKIKELPEHIREILAGTVEFFEETGLMLNPFRTEIKKILEYHFPGPNTSSIGHIKTFFEGPTPEYFKLNENGTEVVLVGDAAETANIRWMTRNEIDSENMARFDQTTGMNLPQNIIPAHYRAFELSISTSEVLPIYMCSIEHCSRCAEEKATPAQRRPFLKK